MATAASSNASLTIRGDGVAVDMVILDPGAWGKFGGLNVRRDVGEQIVTEELTMMRLGGGMINSNGYRWRDMIGPRQLRPPNMCGQWDVVQSSGFGTAPCIILNLSPICCSLLPSAPN